MVVKMLEFSLNILSYPCFNGSKNVRVFSEYFYHIHASMVVKMLEFSLNILSYPCFNGSKNVGVFSEYFIISMLQW